MRLEELTARVLQDAQQQYANLDDARLRALSADAGLRLMAGTDDEQLVEAWLRLVAEALSLGLLRGRPGTWLEHLLVVSAPARLGEVAPSARLAALAELWNLGEGLLQEPAWIDRLVLAQVRDAQHPAQVQPWLEAALTPLLTPPPPSKWSGPFTVSRLDAHRLDREFLPGALRLVGPCVVSVTDRRHDSTLLVLLRRGRCELLGPVPPCAAWEGGEGAPPLRPREREVLVGAQVVPLPEVPEVQAALAAPGGFVVVAATDSQRLWILESA